MKLMRLYALAGAALVCGSMHAATVTKLSDSSLAPLRGSVLTRKITLTNLPIFVDRAAVIELEEFQVWGPDARVIIHGDKGVVLDRLAPPPMRFFRGLVNGDSDSFAYFSTDPSGKNIQGLIVVKDKKFGVATMRRPTQKVTPVKTPTGEPEGTDAFLTEFDDLDSLNQSGQLWHCDVEKMPVQAASVHLHATGANGLPVTANAITGTQSYAVNIEVETDNELYVNAGSNAAALTTYVTNLTGAVSTIYNRDLHTNVTQRNLHIYTTVPDPWAATDSLSGLDELGTFYHNTYGRPLGSGVILLSGKNIPAGIAWEGVICGPEFANLPNWGGPYAWAGMIGNGGLGSIPDPTTVQNGTLYGMPTGIQNYWPLDEYAHEFGHVMGGHHTHCVAVTDAERIATGFTDPSRLLKKGLVSY